MTAAERQAKDRLVVARAEAAAARIAGRLGRGDEAATAAAAARSAIADVSSAAADAVAEALTAQTAGTAAETALTTAQNAVATADAALASGAVHSPVRPVDFRDGV